MILRPVRPASPIGPPVTNRPVGLMSSRTPEVSRSRPGEDRLDDELADLRGELGVEVDVLGVLRAHDDGVQADGRGALVADGDLGLAVGAQVGQLPGLAHLGELLGQAVGEVDRQRHELGGVGAGEAEHEALVASTLAVQRVAGPLDPLLEGVVDALGDVRGLPADRDLDSAGLAVEALLGVVVADLEHDVADDVHHLGVALGGDLAGHVDLSGGEQGLDRHAGLGVLAQEVVEDGVADLVGHLVGVSLGHGLRGEQTCGHWAGPSRGFDRAPAARRTRGDPMLSQPGVRPRGPRRRVRPRTWCPNAGRQRLRPG